MKLKIDWWSAAAECIFERAQPDCVWVRLLGLPLHLWLQNTFREVEEKRGWLKTWEEQSKHHLWWTTVRVKGYIDRIQTSCCSGMQEIACSKSLSEGNHHDLQLEILGFATNGFSRWYSNWLQVIYRGCQRKHNGKVWKTCKLEKAKLTMDRRLTLINITLDSKFT